MEYAHSKRLTELYRNMQLPQREVLGIEDCFEFMQQELIDLLHEKIEDILERY